MENTPRLYETLVQVLSQHRQWLDVRHLKTLAWMMTGLIESGLIGLTQWAPFVHGRAVFAQSSVRRFARWLDNERIDVQTYQTLLDKAATLLPVNVRIVFLADRGFADIALMRHATWLGCHWRIRIKGCFVVYRRGHRRGKLGSFDPPTGQAHFWHQVRITAERYGPVHLASAHLAENGERWLVVSDEVTNLTTLGQYGLRFDIEENFLDDKSNGFQLESSLIRSAVALTRLGFVLALTTHYLVAQDTEVVKQGRRRWVAPHWFRGNSYLRSAGIGSGVPSARVGNC